jgi:hypothetical protein
MERRIVLLLAAVCVVICLEDACRAQSASTSVALRPSTPAENATDSKFTFLLFFREENANTQRIAGELTTALANHSDRAHWRALRVKDPENRELVERYQLSRAPMPLVICVASNGTLTGAMAGKVTAKQVEASLVTPTMTRCMKYLQAGKIVVVQVQSDATQPLPNCAAEFIADPDFKDRSAVESFVVSDPAEARFLRDLQIDPAASSGVSFAVLAPPGTLVGKFPATATAADITAKLHAAGKCCDDPNCKHNRAK